VVERVRIQGWRGKMRELKLTDREVASLIGNALRRKLRKSGFTMGTSTHEHAGFYFPISLDLAGSVSVERFEDGTWLFKQEMNAMLQERTEQTFEIHCDAIIGAERQFFGKRA
jgi:hypothetical protein